jgi:hypothetical protein
MKLPATYIRTKLDEGCVIPFLGAGASLATAPIRGLPSAREVADRLAEDTGSPKGQRQLATVAQWYEIILGRDPLDSTLHAAFTPGDVGPMPLHHWLAGIDAKLLIVTTNYDDLIEQAFAAAGKAYDVVVHTTDPESAACVLWWPHGARSPEAVEPSELLTGHRLPGAHDVAYGSAVDLRRAVRGAPLPIPGRSTHARRSLRSASGNAAAWR